MEDDSTRDETAITAESDKLRIEIRDLLRDMIGSIIISIHACIILSGRPKPPKEYKLNEKFPQRERLPPPRPNHQTKITLNQPRQSPRQYKRKNQRENRDYNVHKVKAKQKK